MFKAKLSGAFVAFAFVATATAVFAAYCHTDSIFGPLARSLDSYVHVFLLVGVICALLAIFLGTRVTGAFVLLVALTTIGFLYANYRDQTRPVQPDLAVDLRVLFFGMLKSNTGNSANVIKAAIATEADILVFAESAALLGSLDQLQKTYDFVSPCSPEVCDLLIATNLEVIRFWQLQLNPAFPERYAVLEYTRPNGQTAFLVANHLGKPWLSGFAEVEIAKLTSQYNWIEGPVVAVGDYNMAPWSLPMRDLLKETGMKALRGQHNTWPASAGALGLPIDQILVRDGPRVVKMVPFGEGLRSNHLGFVADIGFASGQ